MDDKDLFLIAVYCIVLSLWAQYCQPRHRYARPVEYEASLFNLDCWLEEKQRRMMRFYGARNQVAFDIPRVKECEMAQAKIGRTQRWFFCFVLFKLSYPHRLFELADHFGYSPSYLSYVANNLIIYLVERYNDLLEWHLSWTYERMKEYAKACKQLGGLQGKSAIWGFVDRTFRPFRQPKDRQQLVYSKYRRNHGMEWFLGVVPNGLTGFLYGLFEGKVNDIRMLRKYGLQRRLRQLFASQGRRPLYLFGDKAHKSQRFIMAPYVGVRYGWRKKFKDV